MQGKKNKKLIVLTGPTASGKTALAIQLAQKAGTEIISADSRQCFRELNIGVARPSETELASVKHHFIACMRISDDVTAASFDSYASQHINELFLTHDTVVMAGGTGLYIRAFCEGLDSIPDIPASIREEVITGYTENGLAWLQEQIRVQDPSFYTEGEIQNPQRMMRALEVIQATGKSILSFRTGQKKSHDFSIIKIGIDIPKEQLKKQIDQRVENMMREGLLEEVKSLLPYRKLNALQTVGYAELFEYLDGNCTLESAVERIKIHTRQYAKRQLTWFRKDPEISWVNPADPDLWDKLSSLTGLRLL